MKILVDTHSHSIASTHAYSTVNEYFIEAKRKGLQMFALTEHGPSMPDSPHPWHFGNRKVLPRVVGGVAMLRGMEANILPLEGGLDVNEQLYGYLDFVIASFHEPVFTPEDRQTNTQAVINTIETGYCQILGHLGNPNYPLDYLEVIKAAKAHNVLIEINNSSFTHSRQGSENNCRNIIELVVELDWKVCVASDAHVAYDVGNVTQASKLLKDVGVPEDKVVNRSAEHFLKFLAEHNKNVNVELSDWLRAL